MLPTRNCAERVLEAGRYVALARGMRSFVKASAFALVEFATLGFKVQTVYETTVKWFWETNTSTISLLFVEFGKFVRLVPLPRRRIVCSFGLDFWWRLILWLD